MKSNSIINFQRSMLKGEGELQNIEQGISNDEVERGEPQRQEAQRGTGSFIQWIKKKKLRG
jgi:hypothetical protein